MALPGTSRVLLCLAAQQRYEAKLAEQHRDAATVHRLACGFRRLVLLHEHFHALVDTRAAPRHSPTSSADRQVASGLNEALAAWMEYHAARSDPELSALVLEYIDSGSYPQWPYAGARQVEERFHRNGIAGVRPMIEALLTDPVTAQATFDTLVTDGPAAVAPPA